MALPTEGTMDTDQVEAELGKTDFSTHGAEELALIGKSAGDTVVFPTDFYGKALLSIGFVPSTAAARGTAVVLSFNSDGSCTFTGSGGTVVSDTADWALPNTAGLGSGYELLWEVSSNSGVAYVNVGISLGTWTSLSSLRSFECQKGHFSMPPGQVAVFTFSIREAGTTTVLSTLTATITCD